MIFISFVMKQNVKFEIVEVNCKNKKIVYCKKRKILTVKTKR